jgi:hypothetical protein
MSWIGNGVLYIPHPANSRMQHRYDREIVSISHL